MAYLMPSTALATIKSKVEAGDTIGDDSAEKAALLTALNAYKARDIELATVAEIPDIEATGEEIKPEPVVTLGGVTLVKNTDYVYSYQNNTEAGTATCCVRGTGTKFGRKNVTFTITPVDDDDDDNGGEGDSGGNGEPPEA